jgi:4'-phosphopantetheinyl transferase
VITRIVFRTDFGTIAVAPERDEVQVFVVRLDDSRFHSDELFQCLTADERARAERYKVDRPRRQFVVARGLLRRILGCSLGVSPGEVGITYTGAGKPLLDRPGAELHFNVSHTDGLALIATARRSVGIDVEGIRAMADPGGLVNRFFSPQEGETYSSLPERLRPSGFFRAWTCKEALIKASGLSVAYLDTFDVELHPERRPGLLAARHPTLAAAEWSVTAWEPAPGYAAALALEGPGQLVMESAT